MIKFAGDIKVAKIAQLAHGRYLAATTEAGSITVHLKDHSVDKHWQAGAYVVGDERDIAIVGPIDLVAGVELARHVLAGTPGAITDPLSIHALAACLLAVARDPNEAPQ